MPSETTRELLINALKRREELKKELEALDSLIAFYQGHPSHESSESLSIGDQPDLYRGMSPRAIHAAQIADMVEAARRTIISEGRPMRRGDLVKHIQNQGFKIIGRDKNKVFGTNLWRSQKFVTVPGEGYWPKDLKWPR